MTKLSDDGTWKEWRTWLGDEPSGRNIYAQTVEMLAFRQIWDGFAYVYNNAPERVRETGTFLLWVRYNYARSQAMGVRRMADKGADVVSLARLIDRVWRFPWVLSRERFLALQGGHEGFGLGYGWFELHGRRGRLHRPADPGAGLRRPPDEDEVGSRLGESVRRPSVHPLAQGTATQ